MPKVVINCPACNGEMRLMVESSSWEFEREPMTIGDKVPRSIIARQTWKYKCLNCGSRLDFVGTIARYRLEEDSVKEF